MIKTKSRGVCELFGLSIQLITLGFGARGGSKSQIVLEVGVHEIGVISGVEIDRIGKRSVL
jgi:hypothetical protein